MSAAEGPGSGEPSPALLPAGLSDLLPPDAAREAALVEAMMAVFASHGYERVKPPLIASTSAASRAASGGSRSDRPAGSRAGLGPRAADMAGRLSSTSRRTGVAAAHGHVTAVGVNCKPALPF